MKDDVTGGGDRGLWLQLLPHDMDWLAKDSETFTKYIFPLVRWYLGMEYEPPKGVEADFIFGKLKDQQLRSAEMQQARKDGGKLTSQKRWHRSKQVASYEQASSKLSSSYPNTETEREDKIKTERECKPKREVSDSGLESGFDSFGTALKSAIPNVRSRGMDFGTSDIYNMLNYNVVGGILRIIGKENDASESKAWNGVLIKATNAGVSRETFIDVVYKWYASLKVDGEPKSRARALNAHLHKKLMLAPTI